MKSVQIKITIAEDELVNLDAWRRQEVIDGRAILTRPSAVRAAIRRMCSEPSGRRQAASDRGAEK